MRRLFVQIYATVVAIVVLFAVLIAICWRTLGPPQDEERRFVSGVAAVLGRSLPSPEAPRGDQQAALETLAGDFDVQLTLRANDGRVLASSGDELPAPGPREKGPFLHGMRHNQFGLRLPDGRTLTVARKHDPSGGLLIVVVLAAAIALGAFPVVRRITRRLERLRAQVDALGAGQLSARVDVRGKDEIASLAQSFNRAAERIEKLVSSQRGALASASHELRSPLARIRVAIELVDGAEGDALRARVAPDVAELDALIGELLLASRLDALAPGQALERRESVDLLGLAAEEAARAGADVAGDSALVEGDPNLLRRLIRNLLENARRHGGGSDVEVWVTSARTGAALAVADRGPGVPEAERERIFEPFYRPAGARESRDGGFGLGLALVRQIARHHGGDVRCSAREGGGTIFEVQLGGSA